MSQSAPFCPKCHQPMAAGFVVDRTYGANMQSVWFAGEPHTGKIFGMSTGTLTLNEKQTIPVTCFRCPACSYLEFYAFAKQDTEAETILLRPAQGTQPAEAQQLLRGSTGPETPDND